MLNQDKQFLNTQAATFGTSATTYDAGLRAFMLSIFNTVGAGLAVSGLTAYAVFAIPALQAFFLNPAVAMVTGIGLLVFLWFGMNPAKTLQQPLSALRTKYYVFTAILGTTLSYIFLAYSGESIVRVFFITAGMFAGTSLLGYTTKRNLAGMGTFLMMGLIGIILASLVNLFLQSSGLTFVVSLCAVIVFTGLIAYETQNAKRMYNPANGEDVNRKLAIHSALGLYISFINLFQTLLSLFGGRE